LDRIDYQGLGFHEGFLQNLLKPGQGRLLGNRWGIVAQSENQYSHQFLIYGIEAVDDKDNKESRTTGVMGI